MQFQIFVTFILIASTYGTNIQNITTIQDTKLQKLICRILNNITNSTSDTQDILVGHLDTKLSHITNDIVQCIGSDNSVVVTNFTTVADDKRLRKASVIVIALDQADKSLIENTILNQAFSKIWHHMAKIICILPKSTPPKKQLQILEMFASCGFFNVITVREDKNGNIETAFVSSLMQKGETQKNSSDILKLFPDKLKDMNGYRYQIPIYKQPPLVWIHNKSVSSPMMHFLQIVSQKQNARLKINILSKPKYFADMWDNRRMDMSINTAVIFKNSEQNLLNYETRGFCALVPIPPTVSVFRLMIIMPFDYRIWMPLVVSIACSVAVWWLYCGLGAVDSHWRLLAEIYKMFFGQGFTLSRNNHFMLLTLMQLICLLLFVISNAYESEITSCMIEPLPDNRLKTVEELAASNYEIMSDEGFAYIIDGYEGFEKLKSKIKRTDLHIPGRFRQEVIKQHFVFTTDCDVIRNDLKIKLRNRKQISDYYYMLPEIILWDFVRLETSYLNPFLERFQYYMDLSFQAGLPFMWKLFEHQDYTRTSTFDSSNIMDNLKYEDLHELFKVLGIGLAISGLVFLFEIFYHDCLRHIKVRDIWESLRKTVCKSRHPKVNVQKVTVKPVRIH